MYSMDRLSLLFLVFKRLILLNYHSPRNAFLPYSFLRLLLSGDATVHLPRPRTEQCRQHQRARRTGRLGIYRRDFDKAILSGRRSTDPTE